MIHIEFLVGFDLFSYARVLSFPFELEIMVQTAGTSAATTLYKGCKTMKYMHITQLTCKKQKAFEF